MMPTQMYHTQPPIPPQSYYVPPQYQQPTPQYVPLNYSQGPMPQQVRYNKINISFFEYFLFLAFRQQMISIMNHLF